MVYMADDRQNERDDQNTHGTKSHRRGDRTGYSKPGRGFWPIDDQRRESEESFVPGAPIAADRPFMETVAVRIFGRRLDTLCPRWSVASSHGLTPILCDELEIESVITYVGQTCR